MGKTVEFTEEKVKEYLDDRIRRWRKIKENNKHELNYMAFYYIDAYRGIRESLFGELLEEE